MSNHNHLNEYKTHAMIVLNKGLYVLTLLQKCFSLPVKRTTLVRWQNTRMRRNLNSI